MPRPAGHQKRIEHQRQRKGHEAGAEVFLAEGGEELGTLHHGGIGISSNKVDIKNVEHIQHRDQRGGNARAERKAVEQFLRGKGPHGQVTHGGEQHHHAAAVVAAQPPQGHGGRQRGNGRDHARGHHSPQRPKAMVGAPGQATRTGARPDGSQRPQPQAERPGQSGYAGEFDNAEVGKFIDIKRIYAKHRQQKGDSGPFRHPPQLLGLHGLLHEGFLLLCGGMLRGPLCEGDSPQRGEMSRSDRGVRPRKRSRRAGGGRV